MLLRSFLLTLVAVTLASAGVCGAQDRRDFTVKHRDAPFEEVFQDLQDAVINHGLVIDYVGHINEMLARTADVAADDDATDNTPYLNAKFLQFCSATLTHEAVRADPHNLATCPYVVFAFETNDRPGRITVGYRNPELGVPGPTRFVMEKVTRLLEEVVEQTVSP